MLEHQNAHNKTTSTGGNKGVFNFSIVEMKKSIDGKRETLPMIKTVDDLDHWLDS